VSEIHCQPNLICADSEEISGMYRFIHSADWQLGARFSQFGARAEALRHARLNTLCRTLSLARQHAADAVLIAGDLFEDNQISDSLVLSVIDVFREFPELPIYILPGNHDPHTGPDCVWQRKAFLALAPAALGNVHVIREAGVISLGPDACLIASPLHQKRSTNDPSLKLVDLAATLPADTIKIGMTHGSLAIESKHKPDDFPIALNAATRAGLDYLAIGHWHNWLADIDGGRIVMPGTPEPDRFSNDDSGNVALVEIASSGQLPRVQKLHVATLAWRELEYDFSLAAATPDVVASVPAAVTPDAAPAAKPDAARATFSASLSTLSPQAATTILRIVMKGAASPSTLAETRVWLETACSPFLASQIVDATTLSLTAAEISDLQSRHPILAQVLADIDRLETLATGAAVPLAQPLQPTTPALAQQPDQTFVSAVAVSPSVPPSLPLPAQPLSLTEVQNILSASKIELAQLTPAFFARLRQTLFQNLQDVTR